MNNKQQNIIQSTSAIFENSFLDSKGLFIHKYKQIPCVSFICNINVTKALKHVKEKYAGNVKAIYQYSEFNYKKQKAEFDTTIVELTNACMIKLKSAYCEVLHTHEGYDFANQLLKEIALCKAKSKRKPFEINIIVRDSYGLELKSMEIKKTKLDLHLYYDDAFAEIDAVIQKRLKQKNDKGIVLLHGLPGTGKTTYLRYLIGCLKKKVLFLSPNVASNLVNPDFIDLLIDNPNSILIIEDAENIIMDRKANSDSAVSNLLNISDGLLADFLNVQIICTFNSSLTMVDNALMRKGRLIAKHEFGKLSIAKAQRLSAHFGLDTIINRPMTIAEIANQHEKEFEIQKVQVFGFRKELVQN